MGFKLGTERGNHAVNGEIRSKLRFKKESGDPDISVPGTPIIRKDLGPHIGGEANADGTIFINENIEPGSFKERYVLKHEMVHAKDMRISPNKLSYGDDYVRYNGTTYPRRTIDNKDMIMINGKWKEAGDPNFPWEVDANNI